MSLGLRGSGSAWNGRLLWDESPGGVAAVRLVSRLISEQRPACLSVYTELRYEQENPC